MSNPYSITVGRGDEYVKGRGVQQFDFSKTVMKSNPFSMYIDHGSLSDYIEMGMFVNLNHHQERIFRGRIFGFDEDDDGISLSGNDIMVGFPNVFVDIDYTDSTTLKELIYDIMHSASGQRHVDDIDAETFVRPTNLSRQWIINDKPLMTMLKDLIPSSQDPSSFRRNTFFLDPYNNFYIEPIGGGGEFRGSIDVQKRKMGCKVDGNFCNYAVYRGARSIPEPANRDSWTELSVDEWRGGTTIVNDVANSVKNAASIKCTHSGYVDTDLYFGDFGFDSRDFSQNDYVEFYIKVKRASGSETISLSDSYFYFWDGVYEEATAYFDDNENGVTTIADNTWTRLRIPITDTVNGPADATIEMTFHIEYPTYTGSREIWIDGFFIERSERKSTQKDENSIRTFGLFEKRKRDTNLWDTADCVAAAQSLLNPYPKMKYIVTAKGYVPIRLNQTISVRWKEVDWVLPLTDSRMTLKAGVTNSFLTFGGMPLSADDVNNALAAENRAESYGKVVRHNKDIDAGDDPLNHETVVVDDGVSDIFLDRYGLRRWGGKSPTIIAPSGVFYSWGDFNQYDVSPL
ncbi:MAG: hypothetical protein ACW98F_18110 [Candidatus Hodarchaeales archaeon]|jgi:hypothetical protein